MLTNILSKKLLLLTPLTIALFGCGGGGATSPKAKILNGFYKDAGVEGIQFSCDDQSGLTGANGAFKFREGKGCDFFLDKAKTLPLRTVKPAELGAGEGVIILEDNPVVGQVLQSLDNTGTLADGIQINQTVVDSLIAAGFTHTATDTALSPTNSTIIDDNNGTKGVVTEAESSAHLLQTLLENTKFYQNCSGRITNKAIDQIDFSNISHTITGDTVTANGITFTRRADTLTSINSTLYFTRAAAEAATAGVCALGDTTPPVITLNGSASITIADSASFTDPGATTDDSSTVTIDGTVGTSIGSYTLNYNAVDAAGNIATPVSRTITVIADLAPVISLNGASLIVIAHGGTYTDAGATAVDAIDGTTALTTTDTVNTSTIGIYTLKYNKTDSAGNVATQVTRTVKVTDQTAPVITLNGVAQITVAQGGTYSDAGANVADAVDGASAITTTDIVDTNTVGTYTLKYNATDAAGNIATQVTRIVNVTDQTAPVITLNGAAQITVAQGGTYSDAGAKVADAVDGASTITTTDVVDTNTIGTYTLKYNATDAAGNVATQVTRTVDVTDQTAPVITLNGAAQITVAQGGTYSDAGANVADAVDGASAITTNDIVDTNTVGTYTLKYNATDAAGNIATQVTRTVDVTDQTAPTVNLIGSSIINLQVGDAFTDEGATVTDNVDATKTITSPVTVNTASAGSFTLTYDSTDAAGNTATQVTRSVNVSLAPPVLSFAIPWTAYDFDSYTDYNTAGVPIDLYAAFKSEIGATSKFNNTELGFVQGSFAPVPSFNGDGFILDTNGNWVADTSTNNSDVIFNADSTVATIGGLHIIKKLSIDDISAQSLNIIPNSTVSIVMPAGAEKTVFEYHTSKDTYKVWGPRTNYSTAAMLPYSSLPQLIADQCGTSFFRFVDNPLIQGISFTCGQEADTSGTLVGVKQDGTLIPNIGTWQIVNLPNSTISAITTTVMSNYADTKNFGTPLYAIKDAVVWEGESNLASQINQQTVYNQVVFDAVEATLATAVSSPFSGSYSVLATSTNTYIGAAGQTLSCNGASGYFSVGSNGAITGNVLSVYNTPFNVTGSTSVGGTISNGSFAVSGTTVVNYDGSFNASTASGTWTSLDGTNCAGTWTAKKDTLTTSITASYLTANPWYVVDTNGDCNSKFTYNSNGTDFSAEYIDNNGVNQTVNATYTLGADSSISVVASFGTISSTYFSSTLNSFTYSVSDDSGQHTQVAFKNYLDALSFASDNGNTGCSSYMPQ